MDTSDPFFILVPNGEGGERIWSIEKDTVAAVRTLKIAKGGRVVTIEAKTWATFMQPETDEASLTSGYARAMRDGKLGEFIAQNDL